MDELIVWALAVSGSPLIVAAFQQGRIVLRRKRAPAGSRSLLVARVGLIDRGVSDRRARGERKATRRAAEL
jgi:hypothetical protein